MHRPRDRRAFLKASLFGTMALLHARTGLALPLPGHQRPQHLHLYNLHTGEEARVVYRDEHGRHAKAGIEQLNRLLRCHYTNEQHPIDLVTLDFLQRVDNEMGGDNQIHIISGYRSPNYNKRLIEQGHQVAKNSLHLSGRALDIRIPGSDLATLRQASLSLALGGVGYYPKDNFVHIDSGPLRFW